MRLKCLLISIILCLIANSPAWGQDTSPITLEKAIAIAREKLEIPASFNPRSTYLKEFDGLTGWGIYFSNGAQRNEKNIQVNVNATKGYIAKYSLSWYDEKITKVIPKDKALEAALDFIKKHLTPLEIKQLYLINNRWPTLEDSNVYYEFNFKRSVNGYPFLNDSIRVLVNKSNAEIKSYERIWTVDKVSPLSKPLLSFSNAAKIFHEKVGLQLGYIPVKESNNNTENQMNSKLILAYYPNIIDIHIDAISGEVKSNLGYSLKPKKLTFKPILPPAVSKISNKSLNLSEAQNVAKAFAKVPNNFILRSNMNYDKQYSFTWQNPNKETENISVRIDEFTGEVITYYNSLKEGLDSQIFSEDQIKNIVKEFLKQTIPSKIQMLSDHSIIEGPTEQNKDIPYRFYFPQIYKGLPVRGYGVDVTVNRNGKISSFDARLWKDAIAEINNVISIEEAQKIYNIRFISDLAYIKSSIITNNLPFLGYSNQDLNNVFIDAETGLVRNSEGIPYEEQTKLGYLEKHWAIKDISRLVTMHVIDPYTIEFWPEKPITRAQVVKMLTRALMINPYYPEMQTFTDVSRENVYFGNIEAAFNEHVIQGADSKFNLNEPITREELAVILSRLNNSLKKEKSSVRLFSDENNISPWAKPGVTKAVNLGLVKGDAKGNFNPKKNVSWPEAATLINRLIFL